MPDLGDHDAPRWLLTMGDIRMLASGQSSDLLKELLNTTNGGGPDGWSQRGGAWLGEQQLGADAENASELGDGA